MMKADHLITTETDTQGLLRRGAGEQPTKQQLCAMDGKVRVDGAGYAVGVRCDLGHGGNRGLINSSAGAWECQGCGDHQHVGTVLERQQEGVR